MLSVFTEAAPFTFTPKFQVSSEASLSTAALSRPLDLADGFHGAVGNALSLLLNRLVD